ncbi:MAG: hypothetical protein A2289_13615 [Deltaproteobacteria bacterium RIFOXYA12_FULL_58_15]|nr:MAG: hypothetical protein A2289_13615 [Deltaproteobacteria bacterium RIFOXYA12_FULL_58_15]
MEDHAEMAVVYESTLGQAERRGKLVANVAMSRKLVGIMYAIWRDGTPYDADKVSRLAKGDWKQKPRE